jgi:DNA-directed RNA polymerase subunit L
MSYFSNINTKEDKLQFELSNNDKIKLSLANALRRIMIAEIPIYCIDEESIEFTENTSMLHDAVLSKRLTLIPLNYASLNKLNLSNLEVSLDKTNDSNHMLEIYTSDFVIKDGNETISDIIVHNDILFAKLKPQQSLIFRANISKKNSVLGGTSYSPVCKSIITFKQDDLKLKSLAKDVENGEMLVKVDGEKYYLKNKSNEPAIYVFDIESNNMMETKDIVLFGLTVLKEKLEIVADAVRENVEYKVKVQPSSKLFDSYDFMLFDEDHTLGNLISSYILEHSNNKYSGYIIPHPSKREAVITTQLKTDNTLDGNKKVFTETVNK